MNYDEAYKKIVDVISEIQQQTTPDVLYSVVTQAHKQVDALYSWILEQRFTAEKAETEAKNNSQVQTVDIVQ
jgi:hypothetical protein